MKEKKKSSPHQFLILVLIMIFVAIISYLIPAGEFARVPGPNGRAMIDPNSFQFTSHPAFSIMNLLTAIPRGFSGSASVIFAVLMVGGSFNVIKKIGLVEVGIGTLTQKFSNRKYLIIPILFCVFSSIAAFVGMIELSLVYITIVLPLFYAMGFDSMMAVGLVLCSTCCGFTAALTNPFTIGIGQTIAELPMYSGIGYRAVVLAVTTLTGCIYFLLYARKIQLNPSKSLMYLEDMEFRNEYSVDNEQKIAFTKRQKIAGISAILVFFLCIGGIIAFGWGMVELSGLFILLGVIPGLLYGMTVNEVIRTMTDGFRDILEGALVCGIANGIGVVMSDALVIDTIIHYLATIVEVLPGQISSIGMMIVISIFNGVVGSGSGKALITMPIMIPLADLANITRQTTILAYQFGDGITNIFWPTGGVFLATLSMGRVSFSKWIRFVLPLLLIWMFEGAIFLIIAGAIGWGPF